MVKAVGKSMKEQGNGFGEDLAGKREMQAMRLLHTMFIKNLAKTADLKAFEGRQKVLGRKEMFAGAQEVLEKCKGGPVQEDDDEDEEEDEEGGQR